jgi:membrane-bound lytic murein transglycosylase D
MKGQGQFRNLGILIAIFGLLASAIGCASVQTPNTSQAAPTVSAQAPEKQAAPLPAGYVPGNAPYFPPPNAIDLCGEPVPLNVPDVYERFDREFTLIVYNHAQVYLWLKRMERYFPMIEERLRSYNLPDDLKWVAIVESDLVPNVVSPKGAAGPWQFMPATGSAYGLDQKGSVDKRYDFERSTDSAFLYLKDLYQKYRSWSLAIASYNCGEKRIADESRSQGVRDYYHMKLPLETERYVIRILAIKAVLSNPNQYGYDLPKGWGYSELKCDRVNVSSSSSVPIQSAAACAGITYREFKRLNPVYRADEIPAGNHEIKLPEGTGKVFEKNFKSGGTQVAAAGSTRAQQEDVAQTAAPSVPAAAPPESPKVQAKAPEPAAKAQPKAPEKQTKAADKPDKMHTVKSGDTLSSIARHYNITVPALKGANKLKDDDLSPGQKIRIP